MVVQQIFKLGKFASENFSSISGSAVAHGNVVYFSCDLCVYSFSPFRNEKWMRLPDSSCRGFTLAVINNTLITVGGAATLPCAQTDYSIATSNIWKFVTDHWEQVSPSMPTRRQNPAVVTTLTHLIVAGGHDNRHICTTVEVLDTHSLHWFRASSLSGIGVPRSILMEMCNSMMILCGGHLYFSQGSTVFSCSMERLLQSCSPTANVDDGCVWTRLANIPILYGAYLLSAKGQVLAIGGNNKPFSDDPTTAIHCYDQATNSWRVMGHLPIPLSRALAAVLPNNELIVVGGDENHFISLTL